MNTTRGFSRALLRALLLIGITLATMHLLHETSHGVAAVLEGRPARAIGWVPFNGSLNTQIRGGGELPGVGVWCAPIFGDALVFGVTFAAVSAWRIRPGNVRAALVSIGLVGPTLDTLAAIAVSGVSRTDLAVARHLDPQFPAVAISAALAVVYTFALLYRASAAARGRLSVSAGGVA